MSELAIHEALTDIFDDLSIGKSTRPTPDMSAKDVAGWDSFRHIELVMAVEHRYEIRLNTKEIDGLKTVGDLLTVIASKTSGDQARQSS